jgi:hypothetical protein
LTSIDRNKTIDSKISEIYITTAVYVSNELDKNHAYGQEMSMNNFVNVACLRQIRNILRGINETLRNNESLKNV